MTKTKKESTTPEVNLEELSKIHTTKSSMIRYLHSTGMSRGDISRILQIRYQHVRNVLITPLKKG